VNGEHPEFDEGLGIDQCIDSLPGRALSARVLSSIGILARRRVRPLTALR